MNRERIMDNIMMSLLAIHNRSCFRLRMERQTGYVHIRDMVKDLSRVLPSIKSILRCSSQSAVRKSLKVKPGLLGSESLEEKTTSADGSTISDAEEARMGSALYELLETVFDEQIEVSNEVTSFSRGDGNNSINGSVANSWSLISKAAVPKLKQGKLGLSLSDLNALRVVACKIVWLAAVAGFDKAVQRHSLKTDNMATGTHFFSLIVHLRDLMNNVIPKDNGLINAMDTKSMLKLHFVQMQSSLMQAQTVTEMLLLWVKLHFPDKVPLLEENNVDELQKASISRLEIWPSYQTKFAGHVAMMKGNLVDAFRTLQEIPGKLSITNLKWE
ncbi:hypothetical protein BC829DRAFT_99342 [Chytridium lagenaria]|nr:hypothetical protein BC829DRAFT_99342 [Chytridium lagenaria]